MKKFVAWEKDCAEWILKTAQQFAENLTSSTCRITIQFDNYTFVLKSIPDRGEIEIIVAKPGFIFNQIYSALLLTKAHPRVDDFLAGDITTLYQAAMKQQSLRN